MRWMAVRRRAADGYLKMPRCWWSGREIDDFLENFPEPNSVIRSKFNSASRLVVGGLSGQAVRFL